MKAKSQLKIDLFLTVVGTIGAMLVISTIDDVKSNAFILFGGMGFFGIIFSLIRFSIAEKLEEKDI